MNHWKFLTMSLSVLFIASCASVQKTVDQHADSTRKTVDAEERGDTPP
jgi:hypothetical protein